MSFVSDLFFSKLAKYLLFFSPCSTISAFERSINPCILSSVIFSNALFLSSIFFLIDSILSLSDVSKMSFCNFIISLSMIFSCFLVCFLVWVANLIVSFRIVPFMVSQRVFGFASLFIEAISVMFFLIISLYSLLSNKMLLSLK